MYKTSKRRMAAGLLLTAVASHWVAVHAQAQETPAAPDLGKMVENAFVYLRGHQAQDGSFSAETGPAVTAMCVTAVLRHGRPVTDPVVTKGLKYLEKFIQPDGGIYGGESYRNYETCLAVMCFAEANKDGRYNETLAKAEAFLKGIQWDGEEGHDESSMAYGGAGYGSKKRPDLSNTSHLLDALKSLGKGADDPAVQKALIFVTRTQNLESPENTAPFGAIVNDGGFFYTPAAGGASMAGNDDNGGLRSYASMTYAGLKSMIFAGVGPDDPRVQAALEWAKKHYDLKSNPGMGPAGLYYYYHTFAKALHAMGVESFEEASGVSHHWREELVAELAARQQKDGSWINTESDRWLEGNPDLVTAYALLTLAYCKE